MSNVKIKLNSKGVQELLKSPEITRAVEAAANIVLRNAGDGYETNNRLGKYRSISRVYPVTKKAKNDTYKNNSLLKALHK